MTTLPLRKSIGRSACRRGFILITLTLTCLALLPTAQAIPEPTPPPQAHVEGDLGNHNTVEGNGLSMLTTGTDNTAMGFDALFFNTNGSANTASGAGALRANNGSANTADGYQALLSNTTGASNTADGYQALLSNTAGTGNTAVGVGALSSNTTGTLNIAVGLEAGIHLITGDNNIDIGNFGALDESNTIRIGDPANQTATFIAGISGTVVPSGVPVVVDSNGQLGIGAAASSARFKDEIKPMDKASEAILALKPVTFYYKKGIDPKGIPQFGLVAEDVEKVNPALVTRDAKGEVYTVRYEAVNAMLLNEFLKEHRKVEEQAAMIAKQQKEIEVLTAGLQKMSAKLEMSRPAPQTVLNSQ